MTSALGRISTAAALAALAATYVLGACGVATQRVTRLTHEAFTIPIGAHTDLSVTTLNGHINVTAVGEGTIDVSVTAYGTGPTTDVARAAVDSMAVTVTQAGGSVQVNAATTGDGPIGGGRGADVDVTLPPDSSLVLATSNGRIEAINVRGSVTATTTNGEVVSRRGHDLRLETSNGAITMSEPAGSIHARTNNAAVDILNGNVVMADIETTNGAIAFSGSLTGGAHRFRTSNAGLSLRLPADQGFSIEARTSNASVTTDFPGLSVNGAGLSGTAGDGLAQVVAETSNGALSVARLQP